MTRLRTDVAIWAQTQYRTRAAKGFLAQLQFDSQVNIAAQRKFRTHRLTALRLHDNEGLQSSIRQETSLSSQWRRVLARAFRFALVASTDAGGIPSELSQRIKRELAATRIAGAFRAHRCAVRVRSRVLHARLSLRAAEAIRRERAIILTQQLLRGWIARHDGQIKLKALHATTIEKFVRGNWGRAIARRTSARQTAAVRLQAAVRVRAIVRDIGPRRVRRRRLNGPTTTVQTCVRRHAAIRLAAVLRTAATVSDEDIVHAHAKLTRCRRITRAELCAESYRASAKYRGEFQAVFAHYCRIVPVPGGHS